MNYLQTQTRLTSFVGAPRVISSRALGWVTFLKTPAHFSYSSWQSEVGT